MTNRLEPAPSLNLPAGRKVDDYTIVEPIGKGGMGEVYLATDARKPATFYAALKILYPHLAKKSGDYTRRFLREARIAKQFNHPNLVQIYGCNFCTQEGFYYIAQEYIGGGSLRQLIVNDTVLTEADALRIGIGVAKALEASHKLEIVHRDIKPDNIMFTLDGTIKLTDWGIAKNNRQASFGTFPNREMTMHNAFIGTPLYASPEQLRDSRSVDIRADIYSLGATIYYSLVGKPPLSGATEMESLCVILTQPAPDVRHARPDISEKTAATLAVMLAKNPEERPQNPTALLAEFLEAAQIFSQQNDIPLDELTSGTGVRGLEKHQRPNEADEPRRPPVVELPPEPTPPKHHTQPQTRPEPPQRPSTEVQTGTGSFLDDLGETLSERQTYTNRQPPTVSKNAQPPQTPPPAIAPEPEPEPEPPLEPEPQPELAHPKRAAVDPRRRNRDSQQSSAPTAAAHSPESAKPGVGLFWKLVMTIFVLTVGLLGGWYAKPCLSSYRLYSQCRQLCRQGEKAMDEKDYALAVEYYEKAQQIGKLNEGHQKQLEKARSGVRFQELIAKAKEYESKSPPDWEHALESYEKACEIEGFENDKTAIAGKTRAGNGVKYIEKLAEANAAVQRRDWQAADQALTKIEKIPDSGANNEIALRRRLVNAEIPYRDQLKKAESEDLEKAESHFRQALAVERDEVAWKILLPNQPFNYQEAADGLAKRLIQKAEKLAEDKKFADAEGTLAKILSPPENVDDKVQERLLGDLTPDVLAQVKECRQDITAQKEGYKNAKAKADFDTAMHFVEVALAGNDLGTAVTHFREAVDIAEKANQPEWRKQAERQVHEATSKLLDQVESSLDALVKDENNLQTAENNLLKAKEILPELLAEQERNQLEKRINTLVKRLQDAEREKHVFNYLAKLENSERFLNQAKLQENDVEAKISHLNTAAKSQGEAFGNWQKIKDIDPEAKLENYLTNSKKSYSAISNDLVTELSELGESQLELSKEQDVSEGAVSFTHCSLAEKCFQLIKNLPDDAPGKSKEDEALKQVKNEKDFLTLLDNAWTSAQKNDFDSAYSSLKQANALHGYSNDPRSTALQKLIDSKKNDIASQKNDDDYKDAIAKAQELEAKHQWEKAKEQYDSALKIPGRDQDETALQGRERCQKGSKYDEHLKKAEEHKTNKQWRNAVEQLSEAEKLNVNNTEIAKQLTETRKDWHRDLDQRLEDQLKQDKLSPDVWKCVSNLLTEAQTIGGDFKNDRSLNAKVYEAVSNDARTAWAKEKWDVAESLVKKAKEIPGHEKDDAIARELYTAICDKADQIFQGGKTDDAKKLFGRAQNLGLKDPENRASEGIAKCEGAQNAAKGFDDTKDTLEQECQTLLTEKYIKNPADTFNFQSCLQDCWNLLQDLPENQRELKETALKTMVIEDCLTTMSKNLRYDFDVLAMTEENQSKAKRDFLTLLNTCDEITNGAISALDNTHPLRQNVSAFFEHNPQPPLWTPDPANTKIISWLAPLVAKNHQE